MPSLEAWDLFMFSQIDSAFCLCFTWNWFCVIHLSYHLDEVPSKFNFYFVLFYFINLFKILPQANFFEFITIFGLTNTPCKEHSTYSGAL
jgi:hypothetical protein